MIKVTKLLKPYKVFVRGSMVVRAVQMCDEFVVDTGTGESACLHGNVGDYLVEGVGGVLYVVEKREFENYYRRLVVGELVRS
jgi:hypothetical protein